MSSSYLAATILPVLTTIIKQDVYKLSLGGCIRSEGQEKERKSACRRKRSTVHVECFIEINPTQRTIFLIFQMPFFFVNSLKILKAWKMYHEKWTIASNVHFRLHLVHLHWVWLTGWFLFFLVLSLSSCSRLSSAGRSMRQLLCRVPQIAAQWQMFWQVADSF